MAKIGKMMRQVQQARKMQKSLAKRTISITSNDGKIKVVARADMTIKQIEIDPEAVVPGREQKLAKVLTSTVNSALDSCKKAAADSMSQLTGGLDLGQMMGQK
jgi:DNA-binding protein YbaB